MMAFVFLPRASQDQGSRIVSSAQIFASSSHDILTHCWLSFSILGGNFQKGGMLECFTFRLCCFECSGPQGYNFKSRAFIALLLKTQWMKSLFTELGATSSSMSDATTYKTMWAYSYQAQVTLMADLLAFAFLRLWRAGLRESVATI